VLGVVRSAVAVVLAQEISGIPLYHFRAGHLEDLSASVLRFGLVLGKLVFPSMWPGRKTRRWLSCGWWRT